MISLPIWAVVLISIVAISIVVTATWAYLTAQRLHRLHKRCEQAAIALEGTLDRRALAARMVAPEQCVELLPTLVWIQRKLPK